MLPSSLMWCKIWCFMAVRLRTSVPHWLLLEATSQVHRAAHNMKASFPQSKTARSRQGSPSFYNLIMEVIGHHLCHSFHLLNVALNPANTKEEGTKQGCNYQATGLTDGHFGGCLPPQRIFVVWWEYTIKKGSECRREEWRPRKGRRNPGTEPLQSLAHCISHCAFMTWLHAPVFDLDL